QRRRAIRPGTGRPGHGTRPAFPRIASACSRSGAGRRPGALRAGPFVESSSVVCNAVIMETIYEHAGGHDALRHFIDIFYGSVLADPLLHPLFGEGRPEHVDHLTAFEAESFGGPDDFTRQ